MRQGRKQRRPAWGKLLAGALAIAALAAAWRYTPLAEMITAERISEWARATREYRWAPVLVVLAYTPAAFVMFPRPLLTLLNVIAFGPWLGFAYGITGVLLAALATYGAGRALPPRTVERLAGEHYAPAKRVLRKHGLLALTAMRIVPAAPFALEGILAGAMRVRLWQYSLATFLGMLPGVLAASVFGHQIAAALEDPSRLNYWVIGGVIAAFAALTFFASRWVARQRPARS